MNDDEEDRKELLRLILEAFGDRPRGASQAAARQRLANALYPEVQAACGRALYKKRGAYLHRGLLPSEGEVMGRVYEGLWRQDGKALLAWDATRPFRPYLRTIASNAAWDAIKELNAGLPPIEVDASTDELPDRRDTEHDIATREQLELVVVALYKEAPPRELEVFELCIVQEESVQHAALLLGIGENAVSAALVRVRKRLVAISARLLPARPFKTRSPEPTGSGPRQTNGHGSHNGKGSSNGAGLSNGDARTSVHPDEGGEPGSPEEAQEIEHGPDSDAPRRHS